MENQYLKKISFDIQMNDKTLCRGATSNNSLTNKHGHIRNSVAFLFELSLSKIERNRMAIGKKSGGRQAGTPNKTTSETRQMIKDILDNELPKLQHYISQIDKPEMKVKLLIDLLPYVTAKYQTIDLPNEVKGDHTIIRIIREDNSETELKVPLITPIKVR